MEKVKISTNDLRKACNLLIDHIENIYGMKEIVFPEDVVAYLTIYHKANNSILNAPVLTGFIDKDIEDLQAILRKKDPEQITGSQFAALGNVFKVFGDLT